MQTTRTVLAIVASVCVRTLFTASKFVTAAEIIHQCAASAVIGRPIASMYPSNNEHVVAWKRLVIGRGVQQQTTGKNQTPLFYTKGSLNKLRSCYHKCVKIFFRYPTFRSVTAILLELSLPSFCTLLYIIVNTGFVNSGSIALTILLNTRSLLA